MADSKELKAQYKEWNNQLKHNTAMAEKLAKVSGYTYLDILTAAGEKSRQDDTTTKAVLEGWMKEYGIG
jgi:hypothetical protein